MLHKMKLQEIPFESIKNGTKKMEYRLYDEKRKLINIGDTIEFSKMPELEEKLLVEVQGLYIDKSFNSLFTEILTDNKEIEEKINMMLQYYSHEEEEKYGVVGIKIKII